MKKLFTFLALVLGLVSCQTEPEGFDVNVGGEQDVNITVSLPESTRAGSEFGAFDNGVLDTYDLRYILEIYLEDDDDSNNGKWFRDVKYSNATTVSFPVRLAPGREYKFAVWADFVTKNNRAEDTDLFYETSAGLKNITIDVNEWTPNVEARDAFYGNATLTKGQSIANLPTIELTRPFAKVRVVATDINDITKFGLEPDNATVVYAAGMCESFNAVTGEAGAATTSTTSINYNIVKEAYTADATANQLTVFADYILVPASGGTVQFSLDIKAGTERIKLNNFNTAIPVERNKVTSIVGDVLTDGGNVNITINGTLEEKETITLVDTAASLQEVIAGIEDGGSANIELGGDIDLGDLFGASILSTRAAATLPIVIAENKTLVLDLNGFNITAPFVEGSTTNHVYAFDNKGTFTIKDSVGGGKIIARGNYNYGTMTLESGSIVACDGNGGYAVKQCAGEFVMNGGQIVTNLEDDNQVDEGGYDATPLRVDVGATATINGGIIDNICDFTSAIDNSGELVINGGNITSIHTTIYNSASVIINDDAVVTCNGLAGVTSHTIYTVSTGKVTINGGTFAHTAVDQSATGASVINGNVEVNAGTFTGRVESYNGTPVLKGGNYSEKPADKYIDDDYTAVEANGFWSVIKAPIAQVGDVVFDTSIEDAVKAAKAGDTITLLKDITLTTGLTLPADVIFNGNGKQIKGSISAGGNLTFAGHTKIEQFSASYYNRTITIGEGACLEITGVGRVSLAYGNTFNINGSIENAKNADKANIQPSLIIPGGISITGGNNATMNVTNAYVVIGSTTSKNNAANGTFTLNFRNAIAEFTNQLTFSEPTGGMNPTFVTNIKDSVFTTGTKLCVAAANSTITVDNSTVTLGTYLRNSGTINLTNGSVLTGKTIQFGENGGNNGTISVDNSSLTIKGGSTGHAFDGQGIGSITATNGATVNVDYYKGMTVTADETSTITGTDIDGNRKIYYAGDMELVPYNANAFGGATIVSSVFKDGKGVLTFDRDLTIIGEEAFKRITNTDSSNWMTSITLPNSVTTIGDFAFYMCFSLKTVTIPESVTSIGQYAFGSCYDLVEINCQPTTPPTLGYGAFNNVSATCYVPTGSVDTYKANWSEYEGNIEGREF